MQSRWDQRRAQEEARSHDSGYGAGFGARLYAARLIGSDPALALHGGGNVSVKATVKNALGEPIEAVYVKASGCDMATLEPWELLALDLQALRRLRRQAELTDGVMIIETRRALLGVPAPPSAVEVLQHIGDKPAIFPSIETLMHAFLPQRFIDHSHADAVLTLTNQPDGERLIREALGDRVAIVRYVTPGFELAKVVADAIDANPDVEGVVLMHHGLVTFGDDAKTSYERHVAIVDMCERFIAGKRGASATVKTAFSVDECAQRAVRVAPLLRGMLSEKGMDEDQPYLRPILEWRATETVMAFLDSDAAAKQAHHGAITCDHLIRTGPWPMFVADPCWDDTNGLKKQIGEAVEAYRKRYRAYASAVTTLQDFESCNPRVVLLPGAGAFCWGSTKRDAIIAADIIEHTLAVQMDACAVGDYVALPDEHLAEMEFRKIQRNKLQPVWEQPLRGQVVVISGGAGAIGAAIAETCALRGAHVVITDVHAERLAETVRAMPGGEKHWTVAEVVMDVTDEDSVRAGYEEVCRIYGGVDVIVPNAGIAHVSPIDELSTADFRRVMEVNAIGYLNFMREGVRILKRQGLGGHVVINASKNVFAPGKDFGAYSASKAAGHQLGKIAAIELAPFGIRVNMINADAVFDHGETQSGLWQTVGPDRAKSRGMAEADLPEFYRQRNLLKARVRGHHVGNAVVFFASNATPTTGATLPVDGGVIEAFPR